MNRDRRTLPVRRTVAAILMSPRKGRPLTYPAYDTSGIQGAELRTGPVTCSSCGCRLQRATADTYRHFAPMAGRDARGCKVDCADAAHDAEGRALVAA